ncbi:LytR/AlgR family response regulator transcription factor [Leeuwenhoekiella sp. H156]|uniref:LytR/AlgR family response regulator transcription factor n=1 Tax=Leeuwenhoekiella sp. H156 TaxID=3450128 RepID=UPI003FA45290
MHYRCSVITRNLEVIKFFQSFDICDYKFDFYSFRLESAYNALLKTPPSILFVDLDHPDYRQSDWNSLVEVLNYLECQPVLVAISSTKSFAYQALKTGFQDYLLNPLYELDVRKSLVKSKKCLQMRTSRERDNVICLKSYSDYRFLNVEEILYLKADNNTTDLFLNGQKHVTAFKSLKYFEDTLSDDFLRIHNSYIINKRAVKRINYSKSLIFFDADLNGHSVPFSRKFRDQVDGLKKTLLTDEQVLFG